MSAIIDKVEGKIPITMPDGTVVWSDFSVEDSGRIELDFVNGKYAHSLVQLLSDPSLAQHRLIGFSFNYIPAEPTVKTKPDTDQAYHDKFTDSHFYAAIDGSTYGVLNKEAIDNVIKYIKERGFSIYEDTTVGS